MCKRSYGTLDEEGHVYHLRASVAALRTLSADEVESLHSVRLDHRRIILIEGADLSQGFDTESRDYPCDFQPRLKFV